MQIVMTTCTESRSLLEDTTFLYYRYCSWPLTLDRAFAGEQKSDQLLRILDTIQDEYFILLEGDFWIVQHVLLCVLEAACAYAKNRALDRFSLQSITAHKIEGWVETNDLLMGHKIYSVTPRLLTPFALEASIWKTSFLREHLIAGQTDADIEVLVSNQIRDMGCKIRGLLCSVFDYRDAMRDGKQVIQLRRKSLHLVSSKALALYPRNESSKLTLQLT